MPEFPPGWTRTPSYRRDRARFDSGLSMARAYSDLTHEVVRSAYRALALVHHPDKGGDPVVFRRVRCAYEAAQKEREREI